MRRASVKVSVVRRGMFVRLLACLLAVALMAVLCPTGAIPAQAEETTETAKIAEPAQVEAAESVQTGTGSGMLLNVSGGNAAGVILDGSLDKAQIRTITFEKIKPTASREKTCWDAGAGNSDSTGTGDSATADDSVYACATKAADGMWDVVYGADGVYPKFPGNSSGLFMDFSGFTGFVGLDQIDTSNVTDMSMMFSGCSSLKSLSLPSSFVTSKVTSMLCMFYNCSKLSSLTLPSSFDTSKVTDMYGMFQYCSSLESLSLPSSFDTSNVKSMVFMFYNCSKLSSLSLPSSFDTSNVTSMSMMFYNCSSLESLSLPSSFDTSRVTGMPGMFSGCSSLTSLDVSKFNTSNVTNMLSMFSGCSSLESLSLPSSFDTSNVTNMGYMFSDCSSLTSLDVSKFNTSKVTGMPGMFSGCSSLKSLSLSSSFDTSKVGSMSGMFSGCSSLTSLDVSKFNTSNVTNMSSMFSGCSSLTSLDVSKFHAGLKTNSTDMLAGLSKLQELKLGANFKRSGADCGLEAPYAPAKTGYTAKWKDISTGVAYAPSEVPASTAATYVADYAPITYKVSFKSNGGSGTMGDQSFTYDAAQNLTANAFTRAGYTFAGWNTKADGKGTAYKDKESVKNLTAEANGTVTLFAQWKANADTNVKYTVKFNANGGTGSMADQRFTYNVAQNLRANAFTRSGYTFTGWNTKADGRGTAYKDKQSVKNLTATANGTVTLYAQWTANSYTVKFNANGGSGSMADQRFTYNVAQNLRANAFKRTGYSFAGWNTKADGRGTAYKDKQSVKNLTATANGTVTLYAQWTQSQSQGQMIRLSGDTRYDTMGRVVSQAYSGTAKTVIVASGANYPDALSASGLSGVLDAPIVLTESNGLPSQTAAQLKRLNPSRIIIVGGVSAVSDDVASQLKSYASSVTRLGGQTRYDTSYLLYEQGGKSWGSTAIVSSGAGYADALSVSSYAYAGKAPVFLCDPATGLTAKQRAALSKFKRVVVVGGVQAVPAKYVSGLPGMIRLAGQTRYETSVNIAKWTQKNGLSMDGVVYAYGGNYPDALVSSPLAGRNKAPVLLVSDASSPAVSYSKGFKGKVSKAYVTGGTAVMTKDTANALADALGVRRP
ncbi:repeat protein [Bifidobacterium sp. DSM 109963]|uniref:Repeat protein n=2 Tax=Bifidobacterium panos TaxID=2675321 RepID=A0ABX1SUC0_9BIFI|nr:repeat protein [Bifidobacterium sp. DSM 109963]